jgi:2-alkenal reductase
LAARVWFFFALLALGFGVLSVAVPVHVSAQESTPATTEQPHDLSAVEVVEAVSPAVVTVINEVVFNRGADQAASQDAGAGTGFIIDADGHIVTNQHVVEGGDAFRVKFANGEERPAELVGSDSVSDLAVVKVEGEIPAVVAFGDSDALKPGQTVLAIGSPLEALTNTVTQGIVSAIGRDFSGSGYSNLIQHDAAINPGNSGGPLFNLRGEVVGVNTLGIPQTSTGEPVQGIFFAIPSNTVAEIARSLIVEGRVIYPYVGVTYSAVILTDQDGNTAYGVYVNDVVNGSPADDAGIEVDDVIVAINDEPITQTDTFSEVLFRHHPGETVELTVIRDDRERSIDLTLAERPGDL